jgi:pimeloyl-ACP methyl ester carboxylesterase
MIASGDIALFYRAFGSPGSPGGPTPLLILHGSNYFDSYDWIGVAERLAEDREVVAFDRRGFGQSDWSPDKDYSLDAMLGDIVNVSAHFGWDRPAVMGHSFCGRLAIFFAAHFPDHLSQLIVLDSALANAGPGAYKVSVGNAPEVFETVEAAMASLFDRHSPPRFALDRDRDRAVLALNTVSGGYALKRDPDQGNTQSQAPGAPMPKLRDLDVWDALGEIQCPVTIVRGAKSDRYKPEHYERISRDYPQIVVETVDCRHDMAFEAPEDLVAVVRRVLG